MSITKILSYVGLGVVAALIIVVIALSFATTKLSITIASTQTLGSSVAVAPTAQISVSKYDGSTETIYNMPSNATQSSDEQKDFQKVLSTFDGMGNYSIMQTLFLGLSGQKQQIVKETTKILMHFTNLKVAILLNFVTAIHKNFRMLMVQLNKDGNGDEVEFPAFAIFIDNKKVISDEYYVYIQTSSYTSVSSQYYYKIYVNVNSL